VFRPAARPTHPKQSEYPSRASQQTLQLLLLLLLSRRACRLGPLIEILGTFICCPGYSYKGKEVAGQANSSSLRNLPSSRSTHGHGPAARPQERVWHTLHPSPTPPPPPPLTLTLTPTPTLFLPRPPPRSLPVPPSLRCAHEPRRQLPASL